MPGPNMRLDGCRVRRSETTIPPRHFAVHVLVPELEVLQPGPELLPQRLVGVIAVHIPCHVIHVRMAGDRDEHRRNEQIRELEKRVRIAVPEDGRLDDAAQTVPARTVRARGHAVHVGGVLHLRTAVEHHHAA